MDPGLLVQVVEHRDIAAERILVAVELEADTVDLRDSPRTALEAFDPRLQRAEQTAEEPLLLERGRIEVLGLEEDVGEQFAGLADILVAHLSEDRRHSR